MNLEEYLESGCILPQQPKKSFLSVICKYPYTTINKQDTFMFLFSIKLNSAMKCTSVNFVFHS